jgi:hypothetical protein
MKKNHYLRMLVYEPLILVAILLFYGAWCVWTLTKGIREDDTFVLGFVPGGTYAVFLITMSLLLLVKIPFGGNKAAADAELELLFTRAISRSSIYFARATRYLVACLLPFLAIWIFSASKPVIRLQAPFHFGKGTGMEEFYLAHFPGSYVESVPLTGSIKKDYVVLPQGQVEKAFFNLLWVCMLALLYQFLAFILWNKRWGMFVLMIFFLVLPGFALELLFSSSRGTADIYRPTFYESSLGWVTLHTPLALLLLGLFAIVTQAYCQRRYINTEITP